MPVIDSLAHRMVWMWHCRLDAKPMGHAKAIVEFVVGVVALRLGAGACVTLRGDVSLVRVVLRIVPCADVL